MRTRRYQEACKLTALAFLLVGCVCPGLTRAETSSPLAEQIPIGPADDNAKTSRAVTKILDGCVAAYAAADVMHASGKYFAVNKSEDDDTTYVQARVTVDFRRPDHVAVISKSDSALVDCAFIAEGTTVTMIDSAHKNFLAMPQPKSLAAYCDSYRAGEIYEESSGAMAISAVAPMLISEDPHRILYEGISRYIYEGEEDVSGSDCHRLRFVQKDPDVVVILWIDKQSSFIRKASFINSYDADYNMVESYEEGVNASMMVMTWDEISTSPEDINKAAFKAKIPKDYEPVKGVEITISSGQGATSLWESMVSAAARNSMEQTTWSLTSQTGGDILRLEEFTQLPHQALEFDIDQQGTSQSLLAVASKDGVVTFHDQNGAVKTTTTLGHKITMFGTIHDPVFGDMLVAVDENKAKLGAYSRSGEPLWQYSYPYSTIRSMRMTSSTQPAIYLTLSGEYGLRKLDPHGKVQFASTEEAYIVSLSPTPDGVDRVLARGVYKMAIFDKDLRFLNAVDTDENLPSILWDTENPKFPIVDVAVSADSDILLQRRAENGDILWTTMVAPKIKGVSGAGLAWYNVKVDGAVQRCLMVLLSDGQLVMTSDAGKVIYRGQVAANDALVKRNDGNVISGLCLADLNNDGLDEIYTKMDTHVLRLVSNE